MAEYEPIDVDALQHLSDLTSGSFIGTDGYMSEAGADFYASEAAKRYGYVDPDPKGMGESLIAGVKSGFMTAAAGTFNTLGAYDLEALANLTIETNQQLQPSDRDSMASTIMNIGGQAIGQNVLNFATAAGLTLAGQPHLAGMAMMGGMYVQEYGRKLDLVQQYAPDMSYDNQRLVASTMAAGTAVLETSIGADRLVLQALGAKNGIGALPTIISSFSKKLGMATETASIGLRKSVVRTMIATGIEEGVEEGAQKGLDDYILSVVANKKPDEVSQYLTEMVHGFIGGMFLGFLPSVAIAHQNRTIEKTLTQDNIQAGIADKLSEKIGIEQFEAERQAFISEDGLAGNLTRSGFDANVAQAVAYTMFDKAIGLSSLSNFKQNPSAFIEGMGMVGVEQDIQRMKTENPEQYKLLNAELTKATEAGSTTSVYSILDKYFNITAKVQGRNAEAQAQKNASRTSNEVTLNDDQGNVKSIKKDTVNIDGRIATKDVAEVMQQERLALPEATQQPLLLKPATESIRIQNVNNVANKLRTGQQLNDEDVNIYAQNVQEIEAQLVDTKAGADVTRSAELSKFRKVINLKVNNISKTGFDAVNRLDNLTENMIVGEEGRAQILDMIQNQDIAGAESAMDSIESNADMLDYERKSSLKRIKGLLRDGNITDEQALAMGERVAGTTLETLGDMQQYIADIEESIFLQEVQDERAQIDKAQLRETKQQSYARVRSLESAGAIDAKTANSLYENIVGSNAEQLNGEIEKQISKLESKTEKQTGKQTKKKFEQKYKGVDTKVEQVETSIEIDAETLEDYIAQRMQKVEDTGTTELSGVDQTSAKIKTSLMSLSSEELEQAEVNGFDMDGVHYEIDDGVVHATVKLVEITPMEESQLNAYQRVLASTRQELVDTHKAQKAEDNANERFMATEQAIPNALDGVWGMYNPANRTAVYFSTAKPDVIIHEWMHHVVAMNLLPTQMDLALRKSFGVSPEGKWTNDAEERLVATFMQYLATQQINMNGMDANVKQAFDMLRDSMSTSWADAEVYTKGMDYQATLDQTVDIDGKQYTMKDLLGSIANPSLDNRLIADILGTVQDIKSREQSNKARAQAVNEAKNLDDVDMSEDERMMRTSEIDTIISNAKARGTYMLAPNGNQSNLNERQWAQVRTQAFKNWFGDWENTQNASKVVDENGEPMVVYHGTGVSFDAFDIEKINRPGAGYGFHFSTGPKLAGLYADQWNSISKHGSPQIYPVYLNILNPSPYSVWKKLIAKNSMTFEGEKKFRDEMIELGYDGSVYEHGRWWDENAQDDESTITYVAFSQNQIKSATGNVGTFSAENDDIRFMSTKKEDIKRMAWSTHQQNVSSASTSISYVDPQSKAPIIFSAFRDGKIRLGEKNADIGGGRFDQITDWLKTKGVNNIVWDRFNRDEKHNANAQKMLQDGQADTATLSNVLNVIPEKESRLSAIATAYDSLKNGGSLYVSAYKAPKSGEVSGRDAYQVAENLNFYKSEIEEIFGQGNVERVKGTQILKATKDEQSERFMSTKKKAKAEPTQAELEHEAQKQADKAFVDSMKDQMKAQVRGTRKARSERFRGKDESKVAFAARKLRDKLSSIQAEVSTDWSMFSIFDGDDAGGYFSNQFTKFRDAYHTHFIRLVEQFNKLNNKWIKELGIDERLWNSGKDSLLIGDKWLNMGHAVFAYRSHLNRQELQRRSRVLAREEIADRVERTKAKLETAKQKGGAVEYWQNALDRFQSQEYLEKITAKQMKQFESWDQMKKLMSYNVMSENLINEVVKYVETSGTYEADQIKKMNELMSRGYTDAWVKQNEEYRVRTGQDLSKIPFYVPIAYDGIMMQSENDALSAELGYLTPEDIVASRDKGIRGKDKQIKKRSAGEIGRVLILNPLSTMNNYQQQAASYIARSHKAQLALEAINDKDVTSAMYDRFGDDKWHSRFQSMIRRDMYHDGRSRSAVGVERVVDTMRSWTMPPLIMMRGTTSAIQGLSGFAGVAYMGEAGQRITMNDILTTPHKVMMMSANFAKMLSYMSRGIATKGFVQARDFMEDYDAELVSIIDEYFPRLWHRFGIVETDMINSPQFKAVLAKRVNIKGKDVQLGEIAGASLRAIDMATCLAVFKTAFDFQMTVNQTKEMTQEQCEEDAAGFARRAVNASQPAGDVYSKSIAQTETAMGRLLFTFNNYPVTLWNQTVNTLFRPLLHGATDAWQQKDPMKFVDALMTRTQQGVSIPDFVVFGLVMPAIAIGMIRRGMKPPEDKEQLWRDIFAYQFSMIPVAGSFLSSAIASGRTYGTEFSTFRTISDMSKLLSGNTEQKFKAGLSMASVGTQVPMAVMQDFWNFVGKMTRDEQITFLGFPIEEAIMGEKK
ncbi:hypothetical protein EOL73_00160 [Candidatus Saccharibacteria bacterium]|nr:hypothetical protein [Candidatus Saccharibacteria bacterium]